MQITRVVIILIVLPLFTLVILKFGAKKIDESHFLPSSTSEMYKSPTGSTQNNSSQSISVGPTSNIPLKLPTGFTIHVFASNLGTPRDLQFSPGGTLLVSNPSGNQVIAMPDTNHDGVADSNKVVISNGTHIHGLAFYGGKLYVADVNKVVKYSWDEKNLQAIFDKQLFSLPENSDHNNRTIIFDKSGIMYVSVGSTCNVCIESSPLSATIIVSDADGNNPHVFAKGLRNAPFMTFKPTTNDLWVTEMGRDNLGDNTPPDEINIPKENPSTSHSTLRDEPLGSGSRSSGPRDYGWPYCYGNKNHDDNFDPSKSHTCDLTEPPVYEIPAHSAPLGLTFINSSQFPSYWQNDLLVSYHGSWNRSVATGFKVVHMKVTGNTITSAEDFLTGFLQGTSNSSAKGRPVDLTFDSLGNLYISDDRAGNVYIVQKTK